MTIASPHPSAPFHVVALLFPVQLFQVKVRFVSYFIDSQSALVQVAEADIHAVAGLLKMYLRDLPEPLFTDECYPKFVEASCKFVLS